MKATVIVEIEYDIEIPDERVPQILKDFRESIKSEAGEWDLFRHIVHNDFIGQSTFVDGIGRLSDEGITLKRKDAGYDVWIKSKIP